MANLFYSPGSQRAARVQDLFARVASRYDLLNDLQSFGFHRRWKRLVVQMAQPRPGERALDLCCGTGDISFAFAHAGLPTVGLDFSEPMLEHATLRAQAKPYTGSAGVSPAKGSVLHFFRGDAQHLPFAENSFDIVSIGYGLRNLANWETGLREMQRVAKPGGRLLILEFGKPENPLWRALYFAYLKYFVPLLGRAFCGSGTAYAYIFESLTHYRGQTAIATKMRELGLRQVRILNLLGGAMSINYGQK
jgi:demethylmenaquinone methyltransferase/2-methoxy-6-polyprenyl-1,4-benzoquinol methylase